MNNDRQINKELIDLMTENLPEKSSLVNIVCDTLNIHREAAYRRLRGEVKFNFEEVVKIHEVLNLPLERIFKGINKDNIGLKVDLITNSPRQRDNYCESIWQILSEKNFISYHSYKAINTLPYNFIFKHELLSRMHYYNWLSKEYTPFEHHYILSKSILKEIRQRQLQIQEYFESKNTTYIFSDDMFESCCKEIKHLRFLGFVSDEEMVQIKEELNLIVDQISELCIKEEFNSGKKVKIYISNVDIPTSLVYLKNEDQSLINTEASVHTLFGTTSHILTFSENIVTLTKNYFRHLLNFSTLITQSGAKYRIPYLSRQRKIISSM